MARDRLAGDARGGRAEAGGAGEPHAGRDREAGPCATKSAEADAEFFRAFFDTCDIEVVRRFVADDFEMIHDKGGFVAPSGPDFVKITQDKCKRQAEGDDFLSTRKLVPESLKVYPIQDDGAIETGTHTFYAVKAGRAGPPDRNGPFTHFGSRKTASGSCRAS